MKLSISLLSFVVLTGFQIITTKSNYWIEQPTSMYEYWGGQIELRCRPRAVGAIKSVKWYRNNQTFVTMIPDEKGNWHGIHQGKSVY